MSYGNWETIEKAISAALAEDGAHPMLIDSFLRQAQSVHEGKTGFVARGDIEPVADLPQYESLDETDRRVGRDALSHVVVIKLNGGLGTSMGLERAKSLLPVKKGLSFLDIIAQQVLYLRKTTGSGIPLLLMNSFSTERDTIDALSRYPELPVGQPGIPLTFLQNRVPKLSASTLLPATSTTDPAKCWCPPGHGDIYTALSTSGLLDRLVESGCRYAFISNCDNLGAVVDPIIPGFMANRGIPFLAEVTARTEADKKGGHLAVSRTSGRLLLRESAQCPPGEIDDFQDIRRYRYFNTNNLWVDLRTLQQLIKATGAAPNMPLMINRKPLDPRDDASETVLQLETAMSSAIGNFEGAAALAVPRTRFAPVKTTDDLLALWSDAYRLTDDMQMQLDPARRTMGPPVIRLDPRHFRRIDDFSGRFPEGAPSLINCRSLTVEGNHIFHAPLAITGDAVFRNTGKEPVHVR